MVMSEPHAKARNPQIQHTALESAQVLVARTDQTGNKVRPHIHVIVGIIICRNIISLILPFYFDSFFVQFFAFPTRGCQNSILYMK